MISIYPPGRRHEGRNGKDQRTSAKYRMIIYKQVAASCEKDILGGIFLMDIKLLNIGFGNIVAANRIISIISPESAPIKRIIQEARDKGMLIDATYGRRTRAVVVADSGHVILSSIQPETVANRLYDDEEVVDEPLKSEK
jgi:regulator of extracellular matrix RemA (YlzA/DUF370 family)